MNDSRTMTRQYSDFFSRQREYEIDAEMMKNKFCSDERLDPMCVHGVRTLMNFDRSSKIRSSLA